MNINWKVRFQSKQFWAAVTAAFLLFLQSLFEMLGVTLPLNVAEALVVVDMLLVFLVILGVINDPTTPGLSDSDRALGYSVPGGTSAEKQLNSTK